MEQRDGLAVGWVVRWRPAMAPAAATGLVLLERALTHEMGSPASLLRALGELGQPWADPVASVLALMALTAETLVGYVLVVLVLGSLAELPGSMGRVAARLTSLITPVAVRRLLDLLVGGALLAQTALAVAPGVSHADRWSASDLGSTASPPAGRFLGSATASRNVVPTGPGTGWLDRPAEGAEPVGARPDSRSAAPLPPWLGAGPFDPAPGHRDEVPRTGAPGDQGHPADIGAHAPGHRDGAGATGAPGRRDKAGDAPAPGPRDGADGTVVGWHVVKVGDTLWDIAAARLGPAERSAKNINRYWRQVYRANRSVIGADPDLLRPGMRLYVPRFGPIR